YQKTSRMIAGSVGSMRELSVRGPLQAHALGLEEQDSAGVVEGHAIISQEIEPHNAVELHTERLADLGQKGGDGPRELSLASGSERELLEDGDARSHGAAAARQGWRFTGLELELARKLRRNRGDRSARVDGKDEGSPSVDLRRDDDERLRRICE